MKIDMLIPWDMFPVNNGAAMRFYDTAESLGKIIDMNVYGPHFSLKEYRGDGYVPNSKSFGHIYVKTILDDLFEKLPNKNIIIRASLYFRPWLFLKLMRAKPPDIIHAEHIFTFINGYLLKIIWHRPLVLVLHNVEHVLIEEKYGAVPGRIAYYLLRYALRMSDTVVCVSDIDKKVLSDTFGVQNIEVISNSILLKKYPLTRDKNMDEAIRARHRIGRDEKIVFFHGLLSYQPNIDAIKVIIDRILPLLLKEKNNVRILIVGPNPPRDIVYPDNVTYTGPVKDVLPYILMADVCIVPLENGSGTRLKVLEYMACGRPIVSTAKGIEGIDLIPDKDVVVCDDWEKFAKSIANILDDGENSRRLSKNARELVEKKYSWDINARRYVDLYQKLAGTGAVS